MLDYYIHDIFKKSKDNLLNLLKLSTKLGSHTLYLTNNSMKWLSADERAYMAYENNIITYSSFHVIGMTSTPSEKNLLLEKNCFNILNDSTIMNINGDYYPFINYWTLTDQMRICSCTAQDLLSNEHILSDRPWRITYNFKTNSISETDWVIEGISLPKKIMERWLNDNGLPKNCIKLDKNHAILLKLQLL